MMKTLKMIIVLLLVLSPAACGDDQEETRNAIDCGQGDVLTVEDSTYCVYTQEVVVENGFDCPRALPNLTQRPPIGVCSGRPMLPAEELDRIDDRFSEQRPDLYEGECTADSDCATGQVCDSGECVAESANNTNNSTTCSGGNDCDAEETCVEGQCLPACGGFAGLTCDADEFCDYPEGSLCGGADQIGACRTRPDACTQEVDPVCGCDGMDYTNACLANAAGTGVIATGTCN